MLNQFRTAVMSLLVLTVLCGGVYPFAVTVLAQALFPSQAGGSLIVRNGQVRGSRLIGQPFDDRRYFWGRLSATSPTPYNASGSSGSNLGPTNPALVKQVEGRLAELRKADPDHRAPVPVDLVTASASGLDPHITPAAAVYQLARVARARGFSETEIQTLVDRHTEPRVLGLLGEPRVNVLELNQALDERK